MPAPEHEREHREQRRLPERSARQSEGPARYRGVQGVQSSRQTCVQRAQLHTARGIRRGSACGGAMSPDPGSRHSRKGPACGGARAAQLGRFKGAARSVGCVSPRSQRAVLGVVDAGLGFANGRHALCLPTRWKRIERSVNLSPRFLRGMFAVSSRPLPLCSVVAVEGVLSIPRSRWFRFGVVGSCSRRART